jgi:single-stranded-DNA-specific exonuclease
VADMMPLKHINRAMVLSGIQILNQSNRAAIQAFKEHLGKEAFSGDDIGFQIAPILNSAGRMMDASLAVDFLSSKNRYDARNLLEKLIEFNTLRKEIEQDITQQAIQQTDEEDKVLVVHGEGWHEGVIGIVAARIARHFEKPAIVLTRSEKGEYKGSGRSFSSCDLFDISSDCRMYLSKFGGHQAAIGLTLLEKDLEQFKEQIQKSYKSRNYTDTLYDPDIVGELDFNEISFDLTRLLKKFEPYGQKNQKPKFISKNVRILQVDTMGKQGEHLRFAFEQNGMILTGIKFKSSDLFSAGESVTFSYTVNENHFRGSISLQLLIDKISIYNN